VKLAHTEQKTGLRVAVDALDRLEGADSTGVVSGSELPVGAV